MRHLMVSKVRGRFEDFGATITVAENPVESSVKASVAMASINTHDLQRDEHLRSREFFEVERYPSMTFHSTTVSRAGDRWRSTAT